MLAAVAALAASLSLAACGGSADGGKGAAGDQSSDHFGYMVNSRLVTSNAASAFGASTNAQLLSARLYPGAFVPGPGGDFVPNTDLIKAEELPKPYPEALQEVRFTISEAATFSDGVPVTCDDFLLAYTAGSMPSTFGSHVPLINEIEHLSCAVGAKDFTITLKPGQGGRWRYIFGPGTVMPAHTIAKAVNMTPEEFSTALQSWDPATVAPIAEKWRFGFQLAQFDPAMQVSYGPYVIDRVGASGEVVLKRNPRYYGDEAVLENIVVWPNSADARGLITEGALKVADAGMEKPAWFDAAADGVRYDLHSEVGVLTDTLTLSDEGMFADPQARKAMAACVDQGALAEVSSRLTGAKVPPVYLHAVRHNDPIAQQMGSFTAAQQGVDLPAAGYLSGSTVRVGYQGPDPRLSAMVESLKNTCAEAGITIVDAGADFMSAAQLEIDPNTGAPTIDAYLGAVDPLTEYSAPDVRITEVEALKKAESQLWESSQAIPIAAQPRVFIIDRAVCNVVPNTSLSGIGWNMDRWSIDAAAESSIAAQDPAKTAKKEP